MKRSGVLLAPAFLAFAIAGCDSGIPEGAPTGSLPANGQPAGFKEEMQKNAEKMKMKRPTKSQNADAPTPTPTPETKVAP